MNHDSIFLISAIVCFVITLLYGSYLDEHFSKKQTEKAEVKTHFTGVLGIVYLIAVAVCTIALKSFHLID